MGETRLMRVVAPLAAIAAWATFFGEPAAQGRWTAAPTDAPAAAFEDPRARVDDAFGLPDGRVATVEGGDVAAAWYAAPTRRYEHGVLGDAVEAGRLVALDADGAEARLDLPEDQVFEDIAPRLVDLDGDGRMEILTIRSSTREGASIAVYQLRDGAIRLAAASPFIGRRNRWLNIAGVGAFGGGAPLIAVVETPHIGGVLQLWGYSPGEPQLSRLAAARGFSTHAIGSTELRLAWIGDLDGDGRDEIVLPSADRRAVRVMGLAVGGWEEEAAFALSSPVDRAIVAAPDGGGVLVGLADGSVALVSHRRD